MERLRAYYLERTPAAGATAAFTTEMFDAVLATKPGSPLDFDARLKALRAFLDLPEATSLAAANKRIANILRKSGESSDGSVDIEALQDPAESALWGAMDQLRGPASPQRSHNANTPTHWAGSPNCARPSMLSSRRSW